MYELREELTKVKDRRIEEALREYRSEIEFRRMEIETKEKAITAFKDEHTQIEEAAVNFSLLLKKYSITPYNDAVLECLDHLIKGDCWW